MTGKTLAANRINKRVLTRAHGVTLVFTPEVVMVSRTTMVAESLAAVLFVVKVPAGCV